MMASCRARPRAACCVALLLLLAAAMAAAAGERASWASGRTHHALSLRGEQEDAVSVRVRERLNAPPPEHLRVAAEAGGDAEREWFIHLQGPVHRDLRGRLAQALGVAGDELTYIPRDSFVVSSVSARVHAAKALVPEVVWAGPVLPHHKVSPELHQVLLENSPPRRPSAGASRRVLAPEVGQAVEFAVVLAAPHSLNRTRLLAASWALVLGCELDEGVAGDRQSEPRVRVASARKVIVASSTPDEAIQYLSQRTEVHWIEPRARMRLRNKWARGIIQSGQALRTPLSDKGLTGTGQIVGMADTGIDMDLCYFKDDVAQPLNTLNNAHRKVIAYTHHRSGNGVDENGHGTHTAGSLVGKALSGADREYNGVAPDAKIIFQDCSKGTAGDMYTPDDLEENLFPEPYTQGARVRSESWGGDSSWYTSDCQEVDSFSFRKRDFLTVWAAGNEVLIDSFLALMHECWGRMALTLYMLVEITRGCTHAHAHTPTRHRISHTVFSSG